MNFLYWNTPLCVYQGMGVYKDIYVIWVFFLHIRKLKWAVETYLSYNKEQLNMHTGCLSVSHIFLNMLMRKWPCMKMFIRVKTFWPLFSHIYTAFIFLSINSVHSVAQIVYTEFIVVRLWRKLLAYINTLESIPGTNKYWAISVKFLAQGNNDLSLTGFEPMRLAILRLLVWCVNHSTTMPL